MLVAHVAKVRAAVQKVGGKGSAHLIDLRHVTKKTGRLVLPAEIISLGELRGPRKKVSNGDVLFGCLNPALQKSWAVTLAFPIGVCSREFIVLEPQGISAEELSEALRGPRVGRQIDTIMARKQKPGRQRLTAAELLALSLSGPRTPSRRSPPPPESAPPTVHMTSNATSRPAGADPKPWYHNPGGDQEDSFASTVILSGANEGHEKD